MSLEIPKIYNPKEVEDKWYKTWLEEGFFDANVNKNKKPYVIVIPPPNVTAVLHMGHAFNNTTKAITFGLGLLNSFSHGFGSFQISAPEGVFFNISLYLNRFFWLSLDATNFYSMG